MEIEILSKNKGVLMKAFRTQESSGIEYKNKSSVELKKGKQKERVKKRYWWLLRLFDQYFPHMPIPTITFETENSYFYIKMHMLDTKIEIVRSKKKVHSAMQEIIELGERFLRGMIHSILRSASDLNQVVHSKKELQEVLSNAGSFYTEVEGENTVKDSTNSGIVPKDLKEEISFRGNEEAFCKPSIASSTNSSFSKMVSDYCMEHKIQFPEYLIEKQNGVFICKAEFLSESFTSKYAYLKEDAKEAVSKMIYKFIEEKDVSTPPLDLNLYKSGLVIGDNVKNCTEEEFSVASKNKKGDRKRRKSVFEKLDREKRDETVENVLRNRDQEKGDTRKVDSYEKGSESPLFTNIEETCSYKTNLKENSGRSTQIYEAIEDRPMDKACESHNPLVEGFSGDNMLGFCDIFDTE